MRRDFQSLEQATVHQGGWRAHVTAVLRSVELCDMRCTWVSLSGSRCADLRSTAPALHGRGRILGTPHPQPSQAAARAPPRKRGWAQGGTQPRPSRARFAAFLVRTPGAYTW